MANIKTRSRLLTAPVDIWTPHKYSGIKIADWLNWRWYLQKMGMLAGGFYSQGGGGGSGYTLDLGVGTPREIQAGGNQDIGSVSILIYGGGHATREGEVWYDNSAGSRVQLSDSTNWIVPHTDADAESWQARYTNLTGDTGQLSGNAVNTWFDITSTSPYYADITLAESASPSTAYNVSGDAQIRIGTGTVEVSCTIWLDTETSSGKATGK